KMKKISLIITIYNESNTIQQLLDSIENQSRLPDEIVIVDAGSTDQTVEILEAFKDSTKIPVVIEVHKKSNRSQGRNLAIERAKHSIIAVTDAGNILGSHWLERITAPFENQKVDLVAGYYLPLTKTHFQKALAPFVSTMPQDFDESNFLPSSRSVAFTKEAWEKAGRYP